MNSALELSDSSFVAVSRPADGVLRLTMCRPERRNALSRAAMTELLAALETADADPSIGCVLIEAQGPVFSAGHDLKEMAALQAARHGAAGQEAARQPDREPDRQEYREGETEARENDGCVSASCDEVFALCSSLMTHLVRCGTPTVAVVGGLATAAGCQLVASCDLAVASENASFATPGVDIGLFCSTPSVALSRNIPRKAAMEMLLLGERIPAGRAMEFGLVNRVVDSADLEAEALKIAVAIASKPRTTVAEGKANFYLQIEQGIESAYVEMGRAMVSGLLGEDAEEGIGAFVEKRKPRWNES